MTYLGFAISASLWETCSYQRQ